MSQGTHVTRQHCREIQKKHARGVEAKAIAGTFGIDPETVRYHAKGRCTHERIDVDVDRPTAVNEPDETARRIREYLREHPELKKDQYETDDPESLDGHCYVASEAYYHAKGGSESELSVYCLSWDNAGTHWFLKDGDKVIDLTAENTDHIPYRKAKRRGFITGDDPSKRAQQVLDALNIEVST